MGSGSSKEKVGASKSRGAGGKVVTVANVNNNTSEQLISESKKIEIKSQESPQKRSPPVSPKKEPKVTAAKEKNTGRGVNENVSKSVEKLEWDSDSDIDDDWNDFLGTTTTSRTVQNQTSYNNKETQMNSYNQQKSEEYYPETYAQKHTREQYTFGQDRLIREKTIYRNPDEWGGQDEDEKPTEGFDASRFRAANQGKPTRDKEIFSARDEFQTPTYLKDKNPVETVPVPTVEKVSSVALPTYSKEEEDLMNQLMMEDEFQFMAHQAVNPSHADVVRF